MSKQKILIITNHSYMLWQFRKELISELLKENKVIISTPFVGNEDKLMSIGCKCIETEVDRRGINPVTDYKLFQTYKKIIKTEKPDLVITYSIKPNIYAGMACSILKVPYCANVQGLGTAFQSEPIATIATILYKIALKKSKTVFFENTSNAAVFVERHIVSSEKQTILNGAGVNLEEYSYCPYPDEDNGINFLFVGRIMKEKGVDELFEAAKKLKAKYSDKIKFHLVGFFEDEYKETVEDLVEKNILIFHGFQSNPIPFYQQAHCVILPSYHEGMSNVLLEGASIGRALITTNIPGCKEAVDENSNGYLCSKMDAESLKNCIEKFIVLTAEQRKTMGINGRNKMIKEFNKKDIVKNTITAAL